VVGAGILLLALARRRELLTEELLLLLMGIGLAAPHARMLFVFGILSAPTVCRLLADTWDKYDARQDRPFLNGIMLALASIAIVFAFPGKHQLETQVSNSSPVKAVDYIHRTGLSGNMLNEYVFGGYLIWAAPDHPVFVDGRADVYDWTGVLGEFANWATLQSDPKALLTRYQINFCLLSRESPMSRVLPLLPGWKLAYSDEFSVVFVRSGGAKPKG
jgi:hypothetical protein